MKLLVFGFVGLLLQGIFLTAFILVSRGAFANTGKAVAVSLALFGMVMLLQQGVRMCQRVPARCLLPAILAAGYVAAFHLVGFLGFPGLLRDAASSVQYLQSVLQVALVLFVLYGIATASLCLLATRRFLGRKQTRASA